MIPNNYYPVKFDDFIRIKSIGNYTVMYAELDDRIHFEMAIENAVFVSQRFLVDIKEELIEKGANYDSEPIKLFLKMTLSGTTFYKYFPTEEMIEEIKRIKLYHQIIVKETKPGVYNKEALKIIESDHLLKAMDGNEIVIFGEKQ